MPVGKDSIQRATKALRKEETKPTEETVKETAAAKTEAAAEAPAKKKPGRKPKPAAPAEEKGYEQISNLYCELPVYLL